ncbi:MAG: AAA family ATPase [Alphaproteobacteria bacterium]
MLSEIKFIQNIGRFETAKPTAGAVFGKCTLVYGENGWGKSTLADILRSLTTNCPAILAGRKTLDAVAPPKAVLRLGSQNAIFEDGAWTGPRPAIAVYDSAFVNDNVFSGDIVTGDHLRRQYGLVIGEEGVRRVRRIAELDEENRKNNQEIKSAEGELQAVIRTVGPQSMKVENFLALEARHDIDDAIAAKDTQVQQARRAKELKAAAEPSLYPLPTPTDKLRGLLTRSIDEIAENALNKVRAHIAAHECDPEGQEASHEGWLEAGQAFMQTEDCPFCGQRLADRSLVDAYKDIFSDAYKELAASVKRARDTLAGYGNGEFRQAVTKIHEQNSGQFGYWREAGKLDPPDMEAAATLITPMEEAEDRLDKLFAQKQGNLTEAVSGGDMDVALAAWDSGRAAIESANARITEFLGRIKALKESLDPAALPGLENELKLLQATKRRHEDDIAAVATRLADYKKKRKEIAAEKKKLREELDEHDKAITGNLGTAINTYLKRLAAGFRIDYRPPDYRGKEPAASYNILIREVPVSPRSAPDELDKPSFRNTLSAGDKSTLALALFLAKVNSDPDIDDTIIVLDDPFTSLDSFRRQFTAIEIRKLCGRAAQTIVLSHEKSFLRLLWDKIDQGQMASLALQTGAPGMSTIAPFDIAAATQPRHVTERMQIEEFVEGEPHKEIYIRTRLRTVCEAFYRNGDPGLFSEAASLEEIIRILEDAPDDHPYKGALEDLRDINEYSRGDSHAEVGGNPAEETSTEELKEFCRRVLDLTKGM